MFSTLHKREADSPQTIHQQIIKEIPALEGLNFKASRLGRTSDGYPTPILLLPSGDFSLRDNTYEIRRSISKGSKVRVDWWLPRETKLVQSKLARKGMDLKAEGLCDSFQLRGDRMRIIKDGLASAFYKASIDKESVVIIDENETEAESYFPPVRPSNRT